MSGNAATKTRGPKARRPHTEHGRLFADWQERQGLSDSALAKKAKVHRQTIWRAKNSDPSGMSVSSIDALLAVGVPPECLGRPAA